MHFALERPAATRTITVRCRLFARYAELAGCEECTLELPAASTVADAVRALRGRVPGADRIPDHPLCGLNLEHALPTAIVQDGDELALLPPLAGGAGIPLLTRSALDTAALLASVASPARGGTALFVGTVRRSAEDGQVESIEYLAYEEMAQAEGRRILDEARGRWPQVAAVLQHRLGEVPLGAASVVVAAAAPHREEAFAACRYVIEEVKRRLPVWKRERFVGGSASWRANDGSRQPAART